MNNTLAKVENLRNLFNLCHSSEERYELIISLGKKLPPMDPINKIPKNLVDGCQSKLYLHSIFENGVLKFEIDSDALISKGLAALLVMLYTNESPEYILKNPPVILSELNILTSISQNRAHGVKSLYSAMQKIALQSLV